MRNGFSIQNTEGNRKLMNCGYVNCLNSGKRERILAINFGFRRVVFGACYKCRVAKTNYCSSWSVIRKDNYEYDNIKLLKLPTMAGFLEGDKLILKQRKYSWFDEEHEI